MNVLFISYQPAADPLMESQAFSYLLEISKENEIEYSILTFETNKSFPLSSKYVSSLGAKFHWNYLPYRNKPRFLATCLNIFSGICVVLSILRKRKVAIIHARALIGALIAFLPAKTFNVKFFYDTRGFMADKYVGGGLLSEGGILYKMMRWGEDFLVRHSDYFTIETYRHLDIIRNCMEGITDNVEVIPCCVNTSKFNYMVQRKEYKKDVFKIVYSGKAGSWYLIEEMLDFFNRFIKICPDSCIIFLTQEDPNVFFSVSDKKKIDRSMISVVKPDNREIPGLLASANAGIFFINPYKRYNSSPVKFAEYLASGLPVIVNSGIGDCDEIVLKERVGVIVNTFSVEQYDMAANELLKLSTEGNELRKRCFDAAEKHYSLEMGAKRYFEIYQKISPEIRTQENSGFQT